jgi:uncharacterized protein DUF3306
VTSTHQPSQDIAKRAWSLHAILQTTSRANGAGLAVLAFAAAIAGWPVSVHAFDSNALPPIESIGPKTDIRRFLAPDVPLDLARAALRRAWVSDTSIRNFVGLAENQWNFTAPDDVPGFGSLAQSVERRSVERLRHLSLQRRNFRAYR